jgi:hypothetical protein
MSFIVEVNDAKFFVLVEAVPQEDHMRYSPVVKRIEILDR